MQHEVLRREEVAVVVAVAGLGCATATSGCAAPRAARPVDAVVLDLGGPPAAPPRAVVDAPRAGVATTSTIAWTSDEGAARDRASRRDRPLLVFITAAWCIPCKVLDDGAFADPRIVRAARGAVPLRIDVTDVDDRAVEPTMARFSARGVPLVVVIDARGRERFRAEALPLDVDALERALTE